LVLVLQHGVVRRGQLGHPDATQVHAPLWQLSPVAQAWVDPQPPQLFLSVCSFTHAPLQLV
jgi:hypothetical protein